MKNKKKILGIYFLLLVIFSGSYVLARDYKETFTPTITSTPSNGEKISLLEGNIYKVASEYYPTSAGKYMGAGDQYAPKEVTIEWECKEQPLYYTVKLAVNRDLIESQDFVTVDNKIILDTLYSGYHYYYQIIATYQNKTVKSIIFDFETENLPRTIYIEGVSNTRDIGGYYTADGKYRVKQGMIYRGANIDSLSEAAKDSMLRKYGIKTELDLKASAGPSPLGETVNFISVSAPYYALEGGMGIDREDYQDALRTEIQAFANQDNYPIYVHCAIGRDRTGTIAFLINALLGVELKDLQLDFELSFLSSAGDTGIEPDYYLEGTSAPLNCLYKYLMNYKSGGSLQENTELFMLDLGITQSEIASIKSIMLEEVQ